MPRDGQESVNELARAITQDAEPAVARAIEASMRKSGVLKKGETLNSETASRIAAHVGNLSDKQDRR